MAIRICASLYDFYFAGGLGRRARNEAQKEAVGRLRGDMWRGNRGEGNEATIAPYCRVALIIIFMVANVSAVGRETRNVSDDEVVVFFFFQQVFREHKIS